MIFRGLFQSRDWSDRCYSASPLMKRRVATLFASALPDGRLEPLTDKIEFNYFEIRIAVATQVC